MQTFNRIVLSLQKINRYDKYITLPSIRVAEDNNADHKRRIERMEDMNIKKKTLALFLSALLLMGTTACGKSVDQLCCLRN